MYFVELWFEYTLSIFQLYITCILQVYFTKKLWPLFRVYLSKLANLWIKFICLKATGSQWGIAFNHQVPRKPWYSLDWPPNEKRLVYSFSAILSGFKLSISRSRNVIYFSIMWYQRNLTLLSLWYKTLFKTHTHKKKNVNSI